MVHPVLNHVTKVSYNHPITQMEKKGEHAGQTLQNQKLTAVWLPLMQN